MGVLAGTSRRMAGRALALSGAGVACGGLALALAVRVGELVESGAAGPDDLVELAVLGIGAMVAAWLAVSAALAAACLAVRSGGTVWRRGEACVRRYAPAMVRRTLAVAVAAGLGVGGATGALAAAPAPTGSPTAVTVDGGALDLGWVATAPAAGTPAPSPDASTDAPEAVASGPTATPTPTAPAVPVPTSPVTPDPGSPAGTTSSATPPSADGAATVTVVRGDTLWAIAARHLGVGATDAQVAAAWPAWYRANASTIGPDPNLIIPGQQLRVPAEAAR